MRALDKKLLRDMVRLWAQALAIALVMASGVTTLILAVGAYHSLEETRSAYYERYRFADVFASAKRAPEFVERQILEISGVAAAETRISEFALLDIEVWVDSESKTLKVSCSHLEKIVVSVLRLSVTSQRLNRRKRRS